MSKNIDEILRQRIAKVENEKKVLTSDANKISKEEIEIAKKELADSTEDNNKEIEDIEALEKKIMELKKQKKVMVPPPIVEEKEEIEEKKETIKKEFNSTDSVVDNPIPINEETGNSRGVEIIRDDSSNEDKKQKPKPISIDDLKINKTLNSLEKRNAFKKVFNKDKLSFFKISLLSSGYSAALSPLTYRHKSQMQASKEDPYSRNMRLYKIVYSLMDDVSTNKINNFDTFVESTSFADVETIMYGIYASTYPGSNEYNIKCPHCNHNNKIKVDNTALIKPKDTAYYYLDKQLNPLGDKEELFENSLLNSKLQYKLDRSGVIIQLENPSIKRYLDTTYKLTKLSNNKNPEDSYKTDAYALLIYITKVFIPTGNGDYIECSDPTEIIEKIILELGEDDSVQLSEIIESEANNSMVAYNLPNFNCGNCSKLIENININFYSLLFMKLMAG